MNNGEKYPCRRSPAEVRGSLTLMKFQPTPPLGNGTGGGINWITDLEPSEADGNLRRGEHQAGATVCVTGKKVG